MLPNRLLGCATALEHAPTKHAADYKAAAADLRAHFAQLAELRQHLRAYDLAGPLTENRRAALGAALAAARALIEE